MATLTKTERRLRLDGPSADFTITDGVRFLDGEGNVGVLLRNATWRDMGEPNEITVTIEPGDRLNA